MEFIIGFSYPKTFKIGAKLISWWMNKPYSHCYIRFNEEIFHAANGEVHFLNLDQFYSKNNLVKEIKISISSDAFDKIKNRCVSLVNRPYSYLQLLIILYRDIHYNLGFGTPDTGDVKGYVCSELVGKILIRYLSYTIDKPSHLIRPDDVEKMLES